MRDGNGLGSKIRIVTDFERSRHKKVKYNFLRKRLIGASEGTIKHYFFFKYLFLIALKNIFLITSFYCVIFVYDHF